MLHRAFEKYAAVKKIKVDNVTCWEYIQYNHYNN